MIARAWSRLVEMVDELNHRTLLRRRVTNRLCDYNERLITRQPTTTLTSNSPSTLTISEPRA